MKKQFYISIAVAILSLGATTSCMNGDDGLLNDDWNAPTISESPYGNNNLTETNVITIKELKAQTVGLTSSSEANDTIRITNDWQIKARVTGNDIGGNIYNEVSLEDESGEGILVCVQKSGLSAILPVGQEILLDLKGLYIGKYGNNPQIGTPYTNSSNRTFPSRMPYTTFNEHFKILGSPDASKVTPEVFDISKLKDESYVKSHTGKLMTLKGVQMVDAGKQWAPEADKDAGNGVSRTVKIDGKAQSLMVVRSSTYADFAADTIPSGDLDITGVFTVYATNPSRYGYTWQILLRTAADVAEAVPADPFEGVAGTGEGTAESPFNVERALSMINLGKYDSSTQYYITGIISSVSDVSTSYGNATYYISDDGTDTNSLCVFRGYYLNGDKFTDDTKDALAAGKKVTIQGKLTLYNTTPEVNSGSKIISIQ